MHGLIAPGLTRLFEWLIMFGMPDFDLAQSLQPAERDQLGSELAQAQELEQALN